MIHRMTRTKRGSVDHQDRVHVAIGNRLLISAEGKLGIAALVLLMLGLGGVLAGIHWTVR